MSIYSVLSINQYFFVQYAEILSDQQVTAVYNEELYVVEGLPESVDITLVGQRRHIFLAKQSPAKGVSVDLTGLKPGNHKVTLKYTQRLKSLDYKLDPSTVNVTSSETLTLALAVQSTSKEPVLFSSFFLRQFLFCPHLLLK